MAKQVTIQDARRYVAMGCYLADTDAALAERIAQRIVETGESAWHAMATLRGSACHCAPCEAQLPA